MRSIAVIVGAIVLSVAVGTVFAVPPEKSIEFTASPMGTVIFDGRTHNTAVKSCKDCHNADVFPEMKRGAVSIKMKDIYEGKYCGTCHNGTVTFNAMGNCARCHKSQP